MINDEFDMKRFGEVIDNLKRSGAAEVIAGFIRQMVELKTKEMFSTDIASLPEVRAEARTLYKFLAIFEPQEERNPNGNH